MRNNMIIGILLIAVISGMVYFPYTMNKRINEVQTELRMRFDNTEEIELDDVLDEAQEVLGQAQGAVELASNLLGLFEALSLAVTIGGVVLVSIGLGRFNEARTESAETREIVERQLEESRKRFEDEIEKREKELRLLREELESVAAAERQKTSDALLANALIPLGERQYKASDYTGAMNTYNRALELDPTNPVVNQRLAYVHTAMGDLERARERYEKAIETEPDFAPALAGLGFVTRRFAERLDNVVEDNNLTDDERVQKRLERAQLLTEAEHYLQHALQVSPKLVDDDGESWWGVLGGLYKRRGQIKEAIEAYRQATVVTPQSSYGYGNLAQLYMKEGQIDKMIETFEHVEQIAYKEADATEGNFWGYSDLVVSSYAIGKHEQARRALPIAISIAPVDSPYMLEGLVETLREIVEHVEAKKKPHILEAIDILDKENEKRKAQLWQEENTETSESDETSA